MTIKQAQRPNFLPTTEYTEQVGTKPIFLSTPSAPKPDAFTPDARQRFDQTTNNAVKEMQTSIGIFAYALSSHPVMSMQEGGQQERVRYYEAEHPESAQTDYLGGTNPFGNFLVNQYVNHFQIGGKQFVNTDLPEPTRSNTAGSPTNLKNIISTIGRIGTPGSDKKPDGIWQTRTNNALKQIYAVGMALMQFAKDMGISISGFSEADMEKFKNLIPASYTDLKGDVADKATEITKYIDAITSLYQKFEKEVLEHPEFKALISQEKPFADHANLAKQPTTPEEQALYDTHKDAIVPGANVNGKPVRLMDIVSPEAFNKFLQSANVDTANPSEVKKQVVTLKTELQGGDLGPGF